jgi:hypothetical protein
MAATALLSLSCALTTSPPLARVKSRIAESVKRDDAALGDAISELLAQSPFPGSQVNFPRTAGTWQVVHAPHIDTLSKVALTSFDTIDYVLDGRGGITSNVRYSSPVLGSGFLCTDGTIANDPDGDTARVRIVWDRIWWAPRDEGEGPPTFEEGALGPLVQSIGRAAFIEPFSVFPVRYVDDDLAAFNFASFTVAAARQREEESFDTAADAAVIDRRLSPLTLGSLAAVGAIVGPAVDAVHNQALLAYDVLPVSFSLPLGLGVAKSSWLIPPLLGPAYAILGALLPFAAERAVGRGHIDSSESRLPMTVQPRVRAALAVGSSIVILKISEILVLSAAPMGASLALLSAACALQWATLDGSWASLALALTAAVGGPLAELPLMKLGCWHYLSPDYFPLHAIDGGSLDSWSGLSRITAPCYFAVCTDAIALGRWFAGPRETRISRAGPRHGPRARPRPSMHQAPSEAPSE